MERYQNVCGMKMAFPDPVKRDTFEKTEDESVIATVVFLWALLFRPAVAVSLSFQAFQRFFGDEHIRFCWKYIMRAFWILVKGVSILAILVYNSVRFCTLILNILMKCKKRTDQHDTSKSIYILNWISNFWSGHKQSSGSGPHTPAQCFWEYSKIWILNCFWSYTTSVLLSGKIEKLQRANAGTP